MSRGHSLVGATPSYDVSANPVVDLGEENVMHFFLALETVEFLTFPVLVEVKSPVYVAECWIDIFGYGHDMSLIRNQSQRWYLSPSLMMSRKKKILPQAWPVFAP